MTKLAAPSAHTVTPPSSRPDGGSASLTGRVHDGAPGPRWNTDWRPLLCRRPGGKSPAGGLAAPAALNLRVNGYLHLPALRAALDTTIATVTPSKEDAAA